MASDDWMRGGAVLLEWFSRRVGGRAWLRVVVALAAVLALDGADKGAVGASAAELQATFSIGTTQLGLIITASSLVTAAATIPMGALVDRVSRTRLLSVVLPVWSAAMLAGAMAPSYWLLLLSRVALGAATAAAYPAVASLVGDWFPREARGRVLGLVLAGEVVGTGAGVAVAAGVTAAISWRVAFAVLAGAALGVAWVLHRMPEPDRAGPSRLSPGQEDLVVHDGNDRAEPDRAESDGAVLGFWAVLRYVLRVRTNVVLIVSSALGYYMFAGLRTFGLEFARRHYDVTTLTAFVVLLLGGLAALAGVLTGGRLADRLLERGRVDARLVVPAVALLAMIAAFVPAALTPSVVLATPLLAASAFFLAMSNPPLDAARLDVVPSSMWGRAEAVRTVVRTGLEALAPLAFGATAEHLFGGRSGSGLQGAVLVMVVPLALSPLVLLVGRRTYPGDAAAASASESSGADVGPAQRTR